jgi:HEAT repeat protein
VPKLTEALKDSNTTVREAAINALGQIGPPARPAVPALLEFAKDTSFTLRSSSLRALIQIGPDAKAAVPVCLDALKVPNPALHLQAVELLWRVDPKHKEIVPHLRELLKNNSYRSGALSVVGRMGPSAARIVPDLVDLLKVTTTYQRQQVVTTLGQIGPGARAAVPALLALLKDKDTYLHSTVLTSVRNIGGDAAVVVPPLVEYIKSTRDYPTTTALLMLADHGDKARDAVGTLVKLLHDPAVSGYHPQMGETLAKIDAARARKEALPVLQKGFKANPTNLTMARAILVIDGDDKEALNAFKEALQSTVTTTRSGAAYLVSQVGPVAGKLAAELKPLLRDSYPWTRANAAMALWRAGKDKETAIKTLIAMASDPKMATVRYHVFTLLGEMGPDAKAAVPLLLAASTGPDLSIRTVASTALKKIDPDRGE